MNKPQILLEVGVKVFIKNSSGKYLVLKRAKPYPGNIEPKWDIAGGRINPGEELMVALAREVKEETGLRLSGTPQIIAAQDILRVEGKHTVRLTYTAQADGTVVVDPLEHSEFAWMSLEEIKKLYHDTFLTPVLEQLSAKI